MAISQKHNEFVEYIVDLSQSNGPVYSKRMFGGHGIFLDGIMFGLVFRDTFYLKVDKELPGQNYVCLSFVSLRIIDSFFYIICKIYPFTK